LVIERGEEVLLEHEAGRNGHLRGNRSDEAGERHQRYSSADRSDCGQTGSRRPGHRSSAFLEAKHGEAIANRKGGVFARTLRPNFSEPRHVPERHGSGMSNSS
jgi:hypothetical protein